MKMKKDLKTRTEQLLARTLLILFLTVLTSVPAMAASSSAAGPGPESLIDSSRLSQIPAGTSGARWVKVGSQLRLKGSNGKYKTGFVKYKGKYYYFDAKGNLKTGFITVNGKKWFASSIKGYMGKGEILSGLVWVNGKTYFLNPASSPCPGAVSTGFQKISGRRYYFDANGCMVTGWFTVGGYRYYAHCNKKNHLGSLMTGIGKIGSRYYEFDSSGRLLRTVADPSKNTSNNTSKNTAKKTLASLVPIHQFPELPTGCEVTSLTIVLNYLGFRADKLDLADNYLPKGPIGSTDFRKAFVGNPRSSHAYGCYAPVIVNTANSYLKAQKSKLRAMDISGRELTSLTVYTKADIPVMVWGTINCLKPYRGVTWTVDGKKLTWTGQEHCMVLLGIQNGRVQVADPYSGTIRLYDLTLFRDRYNSLFKQAVLIR